MQSERSTPLEDESRYIALLNTLNETGLQMQKLDVPVDALDHLTALRSLCQADFRKRFR